mmetsp:Transcript_4465/g.11605  ORF Transcript_4465/g.11605 Transcript_4465/m.11605 type:complete len:261 (+) Transcript_4465:1446-2228(+)
MRSFLSFAPAAPVLGGAGVRLSRTSLSLSTQCFSHASAASSDFASTMARCFFHHSAVICERGIFFIGLERMSFSRRSLKGSSTSRLHPSKMSLAALDMRTFASLQASCFARAMSSGTPASANGGIPMTAFSSSAASSAFPSILTVRGPQSRRRNSLNRLFSLPIRAPHPALSATSDIWLCTKTSSSRACLANRARFLFCSPTSASLFITPTHPCGSSSTMPDASSASPSLCCSRFSSFGRNLTDTSSHMVKTPMVLPCSL